jgi:ribosomal protein L16 Arg81 hydroxylase
MTVGAFVDRYYHVLPHAESGGAEDVAGWCSWERVGRMVGHPSADVLVAKGDRLKAEAGPRGADDVRALLAEGWTVGLRHAERCDEELAALAGRLREDLGGALDVHVYCTPGGHHGFGWHYDAEDVFVVQGVGSKRFQLRKNTVNPWPVLDTLPRDMAWETERSPIALDCRLDAGDWLYVPPGWWHRADAESDGISVAIGLMSASGIDVLSAVREHVLGSVLWRQRLPVVGAASPHDADALRARVRQHLATLAGDLRERMADDAFVDRVIERARGREP